MQSCDLATYERDKQIGELFQEFQVSAQAIRSKIDSRSENVNLRVIVEEWYDRVLKIV